MDYNEILAEMHKELDKINAKETVCTILVEEMLKSFPGLADEKRERPDANRLVDYLIGRVHQLGLNKKQ
jgi:hypothetical protein